MSSNHYTSMVRTHLALVLLTSGLTACGTTTMRPSNQHIGSDPIASAPVAANIPPPVNTPALPPRPRPAPKLQTYSLVVNNIAVNDLLFALARDARINVDIHPDVQGVVTLNAIDQTLPQILNRLSKQVDLRWELEGNTLLVSPDSPYLRSYRIDYVNMAREATMNVSVATQVASTGTGQVGAAGGAGASTAGNNSTTTVVNRSNNKVWDTLIRNVQDLLRETDKLLPDGSSETTVEARNDAESTGTGQQPSNATRGTTRSTARRAVLPANPQAAIANAAKPAQYTGNETTVTRKLTYREAASVIANPESGIISVRATSRQHERVQEFLDQVLGAVRRQVLIEATVVEVQLSDQYQQGVNWQGMRLDGTGWTLTQQPSGTSALPGGANPGQGPGGTVFPNLLPGNTLANGTYAGAGTGAATNGFLNIRYLLQTSGSGNLALAVSLLESFGKVKVLSSPKISVLNNQTAVLKVVDNKVYFTTEVTITPATRDTLEQRTYKSTINTVPVGFVMSVTPQIDENSVVTMNVRPSISRIIGYSLDPNPDLARAGLQNRVPEIQTREMESVLKVPNGAIAVMGGLMQETLDDKSDGVPVAQNLPVVGNLFKYKNQQSNKSELVVFLRPIVISEASVEGDFRGYKDALPGKDFFTKPESMTDKNILQNFGRGNNSSSNSAGNNNQSAADAPAR